MSSIENTRFGTLCYDESSVIVFPEGLIGFPKDNRFILIEREKGPISYLQSLDSPWLSLPVLNGAAILPAYPEISTEKVATLIGARPEAMAIMVVVTVSENTVRANLLAPILIDADKRIAKQFILDDARYSASTPIQAAPSNVTTPVARSAESPVRSPSP